MSDTDKKIVPWVAGGGFVAKMMAEWIGLVCVDTFFKLIEELIDGKWLFIRGQLVIC